MKICFRRGTNTIIMLQLALQLFINVVYVHKDTIDAIVTSVHTYLQGIPASKYKNLALRTSEATEKTTDKRRHFVGYIVDHNRQTSCKTTTTTTTAKPASLQQQQQQVAKRKR